MLYIHTTATGDDRFIVEWAAGLRKAGIYTVSIDSSTEDSKACAELYVLSLLLERFPGKASQVVTSQGALKKILRGANRKGSREIGFLKVKFPSLSFKSDKKVPKIITGIYQTLGNQSIENEQVEWVTLGRPRIQTVLGLVEVTDHAMARYRERIAETGTLHRLERLLAKDFIQIKKSACRRKALSNKHRASNHTIYRLQDSDIHVVIAQHSSGVSRLTTCYRQF